MKRFKRAFVLLEVLIGMALFSFMLMVYLPGLYQLIQLESQVLADIENQRLFYELIKIHQRDPIQLERKLLEFEAVNQKEVEAFYCENLYCQLQVEGQVYQIEVLNPT